ASSCAFAEKINVEMVKSQTLKNNPSIAAAKLELDIQKQSFYSSFGAFLPKIAVSAGIGSASILDECFELVDVLDNGAYNSNLTVRASLFSGFSDYNNMKSLLAQVKIAQQRYAEIVADAVCIANAKYVTLMYCYEFLNLCRQIKNRRIENRDLIKLRYSAGGADLGALMRIEADVKTSEYELKKAERAIETASAELLAAIGRSDIETILETDEKMLVDKNTVKKFDFDNLIVNIPKFLIEKYKLETLKYVNLAKKWSRWLPQITCDGTITHKDDLFDDEEEENENNDESNPKRPPTTLSVGVNVEYVLFGGGQKFFNTKSESMGYKKNAETLRSIENSIRSQAVEYYNTMLDNYEILEVTKLSLESFKLQTDIAKKKYINGLVSYDEWYVTEYNYIQAQKKILSCKYEAIISKISWMKFLGKISDEE
ncbi:MAG: TolC family protein, partial [Lachnospiraceae bacterium]|nr:TolC family protein [Lachnospiraceae bacterium]